MAVFLDVDYHKFKTIIGPNFQESNPSADYELTRFTSLDPKLTIILYKNGKLQIQGKKEEVKKISEVLENAGFKLKSEDKKPEKPTETKTEIASEYTLGSDETLKGDTFGGLVVAGVLCDYNQRKKLKEIKVRDSKDIDDFNIKILATKIKDILPQNNYSIKNVYPKEYNQNSQTNLMNNLHKEVFKDIQKYYKEKTIVHVVDKYPGCNVGDVIETKAESKYVEVAAASILARAAGLDQLEQLSKQLGYVVPKGSTHVKEALRFLKQSKKDPKEFVKLHFSNVQEALL